MRLPFVVAGEAAWLARRGGCSEALLERAGGDDSAGKEVEQHLSELGRDLVGEAMTHAAEDAKRGVRKAQEVAQVRLEEGEGGLNLAMD